MARLILQAEGEQLAIHGVGGVGGAKAVEQQGQRAARQVQRYGGFGPAGAGFQHPAADHTGRFQAQGAAVAQSALPHRLQVPGGVEFLRGQKHFRLNVGVVHPMQPLPDGVGLGDGVVAQLGAELTPGQFQIFGQRGQFVPRDVLHRRPTPLDGLLVQGGGVVGPELVLAVDRVVVQAGQAGRSERAAGHPGHFAAFVRYFAIDADIDGVQRQPALGRQRADAPLPGIPHPGEPLGGGWGRCHDGFSIRRRRIGYILLGHRLLHLAGY